MNHDNELILQTLLGPYGGWFRLSQSAVIGRAAEADVCLLHESIGREHARLMPLGQGWMIVDLGSPTGTSLNGVRLDPNTPTPIAAADLLRLGPWTFRVSFGSADSDPVAADHDAQPAISKAKAAAPSATFRLRLLSTLLARLSQAAGEEQMAKIAVETALEGTGLARGAMLRPLESPDPARHDVSVVAAVGMADIGRRERALGREVLDAAWRSAQAGAAGVGGGTLRIARETDGHAKLVCAPVLLGQTLVSFLYLDAEKAATIQNDELDADATEFVEAVAAAYALALANLRRLELDRRQQALAAELHAARDAQRFILPPGEGSLGFLSYAMEMRPGLFVAGDLFDVVPLRDGRVAVCLGDVAGHGAGSAMLMATTQSYLHAQLLSGLPVDLAVTAANEFLCRKLGVGVGVGESESTNAGGGGRFVSLWVGVFDKNGLLEYADAGHAHWFRISATGQPTLPETQPDDDDIPLGIGAGVTYNRRQLQLAPGDRVIVYSDGLVEQRGVGPSSGEEFATKGITSALARLSSSSQSEGSPAASPHSPPPPRRDVQAVLNALVKHAGTSKLTDDATIASIRFEP